MLPRDLKPGDGLSLSYLNRTGDEIEAGRLKVDPRTGLQLLVTPFGSLLRALFPPAGWYKVTAGTTTGVGGHGAGSYSLLEQIDEAAGAWSDGPTVVPVAYETNLNASVAAGKIVWARKRRGSWRFTFGACS
jgi:hypothetical protein